MYIINGKGSLIRLIAGIFIILSVIFSQVFSHVWLYFTGFVGIMLVISATTGFCPMELILKTLGIKQRIACEKM
ncbi:MAG: YgaP family membrane protein [Bacillota bacterium]